MEPYRRVSVAGEEPAPRPPPPLHRNPSMPVMPSSSRLDPPPRPTLPPPVPPHRLDRQESAPAAPRPPPIPSPSMCQCRASSCTQEARFTCPENGCSGRNFCILGLTSHAMKHHSGAHADHFLCPRCGFEGNQKTFIHHAFYSPNRCQLFNSEMTRFMLITNYSQQGNSEESKVIDVLMRSLNSWRQKMDQQPPSSPVPQTAEEEEQLLANKRSHWKKMREKEEKEKFEKEHGAVANLLARHGVSVGEEEEPEAMDIELSPIYDPSAAPQPILEETHETMEPTSPVDIFDDEEIPPPRSVPSQLPLPVLPGPRNSADISSRPLPPIAPPQAEPPLCSQDPRIQGKLYQHLLTPPAPAPLDDSISQPTTSASATPAPPVRTSSKNPQPGNQQMAGSSTGRYAPVAQDVPPSPPEPPVFPETEREAASTPPGSVEPTKASSKGSEDIPPPIILKFGPCKEVSFIPIRRQPAKIPYPERPQPSQPLSPDSHPAVVQEPHFSHRGWKNVVSPKESHSETGVTLHIPVKELPVKTSEIFEENEKNGERSGEESSEGDGQPTDTKPVIGPVKPFKPKISREKIYVPPSPKISPFRRRRLSSRSRDGRRHRSRSRSRSRSPRGRRSRHSSRSGRSRSKRSRSRRSRSRRSRSHRSRSRRSRRSKSGSRRSRSRRCRSRRSRSRYRSCHRRSPSYKRSTRSRSRYSRHGSTPRRDRRRRQLRSPSSSRARYRRPISSSSSPPSEKKPVNKKEGADPEIETQTGLTPPNSEKENGSPKIDGNDEGEVHKGSPYQRLFKLTSALFCPMAVPQPVPQHCRTIEPPAPVQKPIPKNDKKILKKVKHLKENNIHEVCQFIQKTKSVTVSAPAQRTNEDTCNPNWSAFGKKFPEMKK